MGYVKDQDDREPYNYIQAMDKKQLGKLYCAKNQIITIPPSIIDSWRNSKIRIQIDLQKGPSINMYKKNNKSKNITKETVKTFLVK